MCKPEQILKDESRITEDVLIAKYGEEWFEKAKWICTACWEDSVFCIQDMYNLGGNCPECGTYLRLDLMSLEDKNIPF